MTILGDLLSTLFERRLTPYAYSEKADGPIEELCHELLSLKGNILGLTIAGKILASYDQMSDPKKINFFNFLILSLSSSPKFYISTGAFIFYLINELLRFYIYWSLSM